MTQRINGRALHYVFRVPDRGVTVNFFRTILEMKVLRHEEFAEGCEASCNGPYNSRWSKTMMGYGPEDTHFAIELTYNYPIRNYDSGNDFIGITIKDGGILTRAKERNWPVLPDNIVEAPGGYSFYIIDEPKPTDTDPILKVMLASTNIHKSIEFWNGTLLMNIFSRDDEQNIITLGYSENDTLLEIQEIIGPVVHGTSMGRIAYSCPHNQQSLVSERVKDSSGSILTPLKSLDTPGKATVRVIICADPDGHEICIVDDESFKQLSQYQPDDEKILDRFIKKDESGQLKKDDEKRMRAQESAKET